MKDSIKAHDSLTDYSRAYINTRPDYKQFVNSGMVIPFYSQKVVSIK